MRICRLGVKVSDQSIMFLADRHVLEVNPCYPEGFFPNIFSEEGVVATPLRIINTEGHITLNLLPVYRYGHPFSIDTEISTNH